MAGQSMATTEARRGGGTGKGAMYDSATVDLDTTLTTKAAEDFPAPATTQYDQSPWRTQLEVLVDKIEQGKAKVGEYYLIGEFRSQYGARNRLKRYQDPRSNLQPEIIGHRFEFQSEKIITPIGSTSKLWARVTPALDVTL